MTFLIGQTTWDTFTGFLQYAEQNHELFMRPGVQDIVILWRTRKGSSQTVETTRTVLDRTQAQILEREARNQERQNIRLVDQFGRQFNQVTVLRATPTFVETTSGYLVRCVWQFLVQDNNIDPQNQNAVT